MHDATTGRSALLDVTTSPSAILRPVGISTLIAASAAPKSPCTCGPRYT